MNSGDVRPRKKGGFLAKGNYPNARLWPVFAIYPMLVVGSVKATGLVSVAGVDTTLLSGGFVLLIAIVSLSRHAHYPVRLMAPLFLLTLVVLISVARSDPGEYQILKARDFILTFIIICCLPAILRDLRDLRGLIYVWFTGGALIASIALLVGASDTLLGRAGIGDTTLGPAYLSAAALVVGSAGFGERFMPLVFALPGVIVSGVALVAIGSRGPLIAAGLGLLTWMLLKGFSKRRSWMVLVMVVGVALLGINQASETALSRLVLDDPARSYLWATARVAFSENPLFGLGWGDFSTVSLFGLYPHNLFLETASELGVLGLLCLGVLLLSVLARVLRNRSVPEVRILASLAAVMAVGQQFSTDLTNRVFWLALVPALLLPTLVQQSPQKPR